MTSTGKQSDWNLISIKCWHIVPCHIHRQTHTSPVQYNISLVQIGYFLSFFYLSIQSDWANSESFPDYNDVVLATTWPAGWVYEQEGEKKREKQKDRDNKRERERDIKKKTEEKRERASLALNKSKRERVLSLFMSVCLFVGGWIYGSVLNNNVHVCSVPRAPSIRAAGQEHSPGRGFYLGGQLQSNNPWRESHTQHRTHE